MLPTKISLYIHIPFCSSKCSYCDFYSETTGFNRMEGVVDKIIKQIDYNVSKLGNPGVETIFIGGGTPSLLPNNLLVKLLTSIKKYIETSKEVTIEANPESIDKIFLETLKSFGVNRLSVGVQTFNNRLLKILGRQCTRERAIEAIKLIKESWQGEFSIDLISAIPTQRIQDIKEDISKVIEFKPNHLSFYSLILEEGTDLEDRVSKGLVEELDHSEEEDIWLYARERLLEAGYKNYEVSNYYLTSPSYHNINYWELKPYLGVGPGGVSTLVDSSGVISRVETCKSIDNYLLSDSFGEAIEIIEPIEFLKEYLMMGLRLRSGIDISRFKAIFGRSLKDLVPIYSGLKERELIVDDSGSIRLTDRGYDLMNLVLVEIIESLENITIDRVNWFY